MIQGGEKIVSGQEKDGEGERERAREKCKNG